MFTVLRLWFCKTKKQQINEEKIWSLSLKILVYFFPLMMVKCKKKNTQNLGFLFPYLIFFFMLEFKILNMFSKTSVANV